MRISTSNVIGACLGAAFLSACGGSIPSSSMPMSVARMIVAPLSQLPAGVTAERMHARPLYGKIYSFKGGSGDGAYPVASLLNVNGTLYGTTSEGGAHCTGSGGCGTVFSITQSGTETVLHSFNVTDGRYPYAGLISVKGTLYGTTLGGGDAGYGTVFSITISGTESILWSFKGVPDGDGPGAGLINVSGKLYGTTGYGGSVGGSYCEPASFSCGTVFEVSTSGKENVLYNFRGGESDTDHPIAPLIDLNGTFYGTTFGISGADVGAVYSVTTSGHENVLYSFKGVFGDGAMPAAGLTDVNGTLYGTTTIGGTAGEGTVFSVTTNGTERVLHSFKGNGGAEPYSGLTYLNGMLYGTTRNGGTTNNGTIFGITTAGVQRVLYDFKDGKDGAHPEGGLLQFKGSLYGTTSEGGTYGYGTVFSLSP
jgi:uncharacterized repeat protein (TIGR03803 family)